MRILKESDIRPDDHMDVIYYMLERDRSEWYDIVKKYVTGENESTHTIEINNSSCYINASLESFKANYRGKFNLGDYVTTKRGGKYRIVGLPYLDYRWMNHWFNDPDNIDYTLSVNFARIEQFGLSYTLAGIDDNGISSGTEYYLYFENHDEYGVDLLVGECTDENLTLLENITQEEKDLIDKKASEIFVLEK